MTFLCGVPAHAQPECDQNAYFLPAQDANGWTLRPQVTSTTKIYYVSANQPSGGYTNGSDSNNGLTTTTPFATFAKVWDVLSGQRSGLKIEARVRVLRGSTFYTTPKPADVHGSWGGMGPLKPLIVEAWPPEPEVGKPANRPKFVLPLEPNGSVPTAQPILSDFSGTSPSWRQATGETTTAETLINDPFEIFRDPSRNLFGYMESVGLPTGGETTPYKVTRNFMDLCEDQRRGYWNSSLRATLVNDYIREGFTAP